MNTHLRSSFVVLLVASLTACAGASAQKRAKPSAKVNEASVNALYAQLDKDSLRFEAGLELARNGDLKNAQTELKAALDDLQATAVRCDAMSGCEGSRFVSAYDRLLRLGIEDSPGDGTDAETGDSEPATTESGESSPLIASLPAMERTITLLKGRELADILTINDAVKAGLEQWLTQYRPNLMTAYVNYQFMRYRMWPEYHKAGLPEALLFGMLAKESGGRVHAVSRAGASGPLQFMYATGLRFGLTSSGGFDQRFDPGLSARANAAYINEQLAIFNGNLELVIAAYNGGEGRIQRLAGRGGGTSFWDPKVYGTLPVETRDYVPMVLAAAWLFLHPERYNLEFPKIDGRPGSLLLTQPATLAELTVCFGNEGGVYEGWFRALRNLNPALDPQQRLAAGTRLEVPAQLESVYARSCTSGHWAVLARELNAATTVISASKPAPVPATREAANSGAKSSNVARVYTVRKGDNLAGIARKTGCGKTEEIARLNGIRAPHYSIREGQKLRLPSCAAR
jgi:membrane-bound lytic murein transglycosylase D